MIRTDKRLRLCTVLILCCLTFIWGNSLMPGEVSGAFSDWVKDILGSLLGWSSDGGPGGGLLRKIAHFTEFASLGALLGWYVGMLRKPPICAFCAGTAAACIDETIQRFVPDRGPSIRDVVIDSSGVLFGMFLLFLGHTYYVRHLKKPLEDTK